MNKYEKKEHGPYTHSGQQTVESHRIKEITYFCGCKVTLSAWAEKDAAFSCMDHHEPIKEIVETISFMKIYGK